MKVLLGLLAIFLRKLRRIFISPQVHPAQAHPQAGPSSDLEDDDDLSPFELLFQIFEHIKVR